MIRLVGCPGLSQSSLDAQPFCWFCHEAAQICFRYFTALSYQVQAGIGDCITQYKPTLNQKVQEIIDTLIGAELAKQDPNTLVVTVEDAKLSQMLTALCETQRYTTIAIRLGLYPFNADICI